MFWRLKFTRRESTVLIFTWTLDWLWLRTPCFLPQECETRSMCYEACIVVKAGTQPDGDIGVREVAGARYAVATHLGSYANFSETYSQLLGQWMPAEDCEPAADQPCLEF